MTYTFFFAKISANFGDVMIFKIREGLKNSVHVYDDVIEITVKNFNILLEENYIKNFICLLLKDESIFNVFNFPDSVINNLVDYIVEGEDFSCFSETFLKENIPLYSILFNTFSLYKRKYFALCDLYKASKIIIKCNGNNIMRGITLSQKFNKNVTIDGSSISLERYKSILENLDLEKLEKNNIDIIYQEFNSAISPYKLYYISSLVCATVRKIKKYDLSPLEQLIYVYDIVKKRMYIKEKSGDSRASRDLDRVLSGDSIVCEGYINWYNAILRCLFINATSIRSLDVCHQRSVLYIKDPKYNIDGVYTFDPTWDRRKSIDDTSYLANYNYFAIPVKQSNIDAPDSLFDPLDYSLDDLINLSSKDDNITLSSKILSNLEILFSLISENFKDFEEDLCLNVFFNGKIKNKLSTIYSNFQSKYFVSNIKPEVFLIALYNTRKAEYYNNDIDDLSLDDIVLTVKDRYMNLKRRELGENKELSFLNILLILMKYDEELSLKFEKINDGMKNFLSNDTFTKRVKKI